ncbi:MAG: glucan ABC transporter ATP-binding protein/ permease [Desulfobacterales bacterium]|jgi:ATP-binding cassette, subfamily B, beta-glucan exporter|nr:glucan ABC transporter ATP-binding protein/ permease [Desulfobacterales bacterium]
MRTSHFFTVYGRVLELLRPVRGLAVTLTLANLALAAIPFLDPLLFGKAIDLLSNAAARGAEATFHDGVRIFGLWAAVGVGGIGARILVSLHADRLAHRQRLNVTAMFFEHVLQLHLAYHRSAHSGRLIKIMLQGSDQLFGLWLGMFREHLSTLVALLVLLPMTLFLNWQLALLMIVLVTGSALLTAYVSRRTFSAQGEVEEYRSTLAERAGDAIGNVVLVQSFVRLSAEMRMMRDVIERLLSIQFPVLNWWAVVSVLQGAVATITVISIFAMGAWLNLKGEASVGEIVTFMGFATHLLGRMDQVVGFVNGLFMEVHSLGEFFEVLDTRSAVADRPGARPIENVKGRVEFDRVSFSYDPQRKALVDVSFTVEPGQTAALVGETGAGKSTAMGLLHRQDDPQGGAIRIDGVDIRDVTIDSLRAHTGVVFQESLLFFRSIADNLRVGKPDATDAELEEAARLACAHDFILRQPRGYQTRIGERGANLSGGERQRLAIARVLLKNPPLLILDEATSALDAATEAQVQQALKTLKQGRTTFIIAHRLATIRDADLILVFQNGRVIERGSFQELVRQGGFFAQLVATQFQNPAAAESETRQADTAVPLPSDSM